MKIYWVNEYRHWDEDEPRISSVDFYATKELAQVEADRRIELLRLQWEKDEKKNSGIRERRETAKAELEAAGLSTVDFPLNLPYAPQPQEFKHKVFIDDIDVIEPPAAKPFVPTCGGMNCYLLDCECVEDRYRDEQETYMDPRCGCPDDYASCPIHGPKDVSVEPCYHCGDPTGLFSPHVVRKHLDDGSFEFNCERVVEYKLPNKKRGEASHPLFP